MSDSRERYTPQRILEMPRKRVALLALELQEALARREGEAQEPIAVVGMGCRFPGGVDSADSYWTLLDRGNDAIGPVPKERWDADALHDPDSDAPGRVASRFGGFLDDVARFDAPFFSISPREARTMDPQQRILLETSWRAFEDAAIPPDTLRGSRTGVFIGVCNNDYLMRILSEGTEAIDVYMSSGNAYSVVSGRLSFVFGFEGPALSIDTACSSSLVAIASACRSLRVGESDVAVTGGVNVMSSPETTIALSRAGMLAPDGRCKAFDESADGFVRSEGCGVLILKRLSDAKRDGDRIHAVLRGAAVGQDGRSTGLTVPNGPAQASVIRDALANSGLIPADVQLIEAHGTGTSLGDPIEMGALRTVFAEERATPLLVGAAKSNIGHLESAAGVAGLIKAILAVGRGRIPGNLHFDRPSTRIEWESWPVRVPTETVEWPESDGPRRAGVSSFGFSGTNAHIVVEEAPSTPTAAPHSSLPTELLLVSANSSEALDAVRNDFVETLDSLPAASLGAMGHTSRVGRTAFRHRSAAVGRTASELRQALAGEEGSGYRVDSDGKCPAAPEWVFVFTGQGAQHPGMGRALYEQAPVFRDRIDRCAEILSGKLDLPLTSILFEGSGDSAPLYRTTVAQPAIVAFEWALAELWASWGIEPAAVIGHSLGEFAAAIVAGIWTIEDGLGLVAERGRLLDSLPKGDRMAAVFADADVVEEMVSAVTRAGGRLETSAYNAPESVVLGGDPDAIGRLIVEAAEREVETRTLKLERAFHTSSVDPILDRLEAAAGGPETRDPRIPIAFNVSGTVGSRAPEAGYWREHARRPVRFHGGVQALFETGYRHFLEIGPHPTLAPLIAQTLDEEPVVVPSQHRDRDGWTAWCEAAARLFVAGADLDGFGVRSDRPERIPIPGHPLRGDRFWVERRQPGAPAVQSGTPSYGGFPGTRLHTALPTWETVFVPDAPEFLRHHRFDGESVVPGPAFAQLALEAARNLRPDVNTIEELRILVPAIVGESGLRIQTVLLDERTEDWSFRILARAVGAGEDRPWIEHANGRVAKRPSALPEDGFAGSTAPIGGSPAPLQPVSLDGHRALLESLGFELGPPAIVYRDPHAGSGRAEASFAPPPSDEASEEEAVGSVGSLLALDGAAQLLGIALTDEAAARGVPIEPHMVSRVGRIEWFGDPSRAVRGMARVSKRDENGAALGDVRLESAEGSLLAALSDIELTRVRPGGRVAEPGWLHRQEWRRISGAPSAAATLDESALAEVVEECRGEWLALATACDLPAYDRSRAGLNSRAVRWIREALSEFSEMAGDGEAVPNRVDPERRKAFARLRAIARTTQDDGNEPEPGSEPGSLHEITSIEAWIDRCGGALVSVLTGARDPVDLLFGEDRGALAESIYADTPFGRAYNRQIGAAVRALAARVPEGAPIRILEVGAGTGSATRPVLEALKGRVFEYRWTDLSPVLVERARASIGELAEHDDEARITFEVLDLDREIDAQGIASESFDLVVAGSVVHATRDVGETLSRLRRALRPGGVAILLEAIESEPWVDMTFGLTPGWWAFQDEDRRPDYPLLPDPAWREVLEECGFSAVADLTGGGPQEVFVARRPDSAAPVVLDVRGESTLSEVLLRVRAVVDGDAGSGSESEHAKVWFVTANAQATDDAEPTNPRQAAVWGLARTFALEHPELWGGIVDVEGGDDRSASEVVEAFVHEYGDEDQFAHRPGGVFVPRVVSVDPEGRGEEGSPVVTRGCWVLVGGLGGLGLEWADELLRRGAEQVVLVGRTGPDSWTKDDPRRARLREIEARDGAVTIHIADASDAEAMRGLFAELRSTGPAVRGVVHAAAAIESYAIASLATENLERALIAKGGIASILAEVTAEDDLDHLLFFSSTTSLFGVAGFAAYAAANQTLDAHAHTLRREGRPARAIQWGVWERMRGVDAEMRAHYERAGWRPMRADSVFGLLDTILAPAGAATLVVADAEWDRLRSVYESRRSRPLLSEVGRSPASTSSSTSMSNSTPTSSPTASAGRQDGRIDIRALDPARRREVLLERVEGEVKDVLRVPAGRRIDLDEGFFDMGMDSLMSVELKNRLARSFELKLSGTLAFNYPSVRRLADYLETRISASQSEMQSVEGSLPILPDEPNRARTAPASEEGSTGDGSVEAELMRRLERLEGKGR